MGQFSDEDKAIIKNDFLEKGWCAYTIWREHPQKKWNRVSVWRLVKGIKERGTTDRKKGSGRPVTATTDENCEIVEELICSQEGEAGTHDPPTKIAEKLGVSRSSVQRMFKKREMNQSKRVSEPHRDEGALERRRSRAENLVTRFEKNSRAVEKLVFQDEKDFPLQVPLNRQNNRVYHKGLKRNVSSERLFFESKRQSKKVMVSAGLTWQGVTKPFFVGGRGIKVNSVNYHKHLKKELFPAIEKLVNRDDWIFVQDGASSHTSNLVQDFLRDELKRRFVAGTEWPPYSPDSNPLDYYFWERVKTKVYEGRHNNPFRNEGELRGSKKCGKIVQMIKRKSAPQSSNFSHDLRRLLSLREAQSRKSTRDISARFKLLIYNNSFV